MSLERWLIWIGIVPKNPFMLRSTYARLGRDENGNSWSVPFKAELVRFNLITLPAWLQETPNQLHGVELVYWLLEEFVALLGRRVHEGRGDWASFRRLAFQMSRASASASLSAFREIEATSNEECKMANETRETRENTFFKLVNAMGVCFWSCKLILSIQNVQAYPHYYFTGLRFGCLLQSDTMDHCFLLFFVWKVSLHGSKLYYFVSS